MTWETMIALAVAFFVLMVTPGPGTMAVLGRGLAGGFMATVPFMFGMLLGDLVYLLAAVVGLAALAAEYGGILSAVRWIGAAYLVYLGIKLWRAPAVAMVDVSGHRVGVGRDFVGGFALTLGNPKVILCYTAFLPGFVDLAALSAADAVVIAAIVSGVLLATLAGYALLASRLKNVFRGSTAQRRLNRTSGAVMIGAGAVIATRQ